MGDAVGDQYNDTCRNNVYVPGSSIPYTTESNPVVKEFRAGYAKYQPGQPVPPVGARGVVRRATCCADALLQMGPAPTRKGFEDYLHGLKDYTGGDVMVRLRVLARSTTTRPRGRSASPLPAGWTARAVG